MIRVSMARLPSGAVWVAPLPEAGLAPKA
jgi:hypothetical protein